MYVLDPQISLPYVIPTFSIDAVKIVCVNETMFL